MVGQWARVPVHLPENSKPGFGWESKNFSRISRRVSGEIAPELQVENFIKSWDSVNDISSLISRLEIRIICNASLS